MLSAGTIVMICGAPLLLIGVIFLVIRKLTWKCTAQTKGQVIDMCMNAFDYNMGNRGDVAFVIRTGSSSPGSRCPVYSYYVNGQEYRRAGSVAYNMGYIHKMMEKPVVVYYNPQKPEQSSLGKLNVFALMGIIFSAFGVVTIIVGIILLVNGI